MSRIPEDQWKWFGSAAHFICAFDCHWHLSTLIGGHVVSTVGEHVLPADVAKVVGQRYSRIAYEDMGASKGCKYETMVFTAVPCEGACNCGEPFITDHNSLISGRAKTRREAKEMHMRFCDLVSLGDFE